MDAIRDLIAEIDEPQTTDYWRVRLRKQRDLWRDGVALRTEGEEDENAPGEYEGWQVGAVHTGGRFMVRARAKRAWESHDPGFRNWLYDQPFWLHQTGADKFFCVRDVTQQHLDATSPNSPRVPRPLGDLTQGHPAHTHSARRSERGAPGREALS